MHKEFKRIVGNSDKAILFVHGIVGTPNHFKDFLPYVPKDISVYNILLDGHGKGVKDFSKTSMKKWEKQVTEAVEELEQDHKEIYIVAHSLGCLLAIEQAVCHSKVTKLFMLAVPLKLRLKPKMFINSLKVYFDKINPENKEVVAAKECYGIENEKNPFLYLGWIPRFLELFSKIRKTRKIMGDITIPCVACQSSNDEMVSKKARSMLENNSMISVIDLINSGHYYYEEKDIFLMKKIFMEFIYEE